MRPAATPRDRCADVIVVGAGLGGLAAGAALARRGMRVLVCEQHDVPGGYAHRFLRRPRGSDVVYSFDVALHQIGGLRPGRKLFGALGALGVLDRIGLRSFATVYRTRGPAHDFQVAAAANIYLQKLEELFPDHRRGLGELFAHLQRVDLGVANPDDPPAEALALLGKSAAAFILDHVPDERFLAVFSSLWAYLGFPPAQLCAFMFAQVWCSYHLGGCHYIEGGGQALADALVAIIEEHGGQVLLRTAVEAITTTGGRVTGVVTDWHGALAAAVVVSNASALATFGTLLDQAALAAREQRVLATAPVSVSISELYLGMRGRAEELGLPDRLAIDMPSYDLAAQWQAVQRGDLAGAPCVLANHNLSDPGGMCRAIDPS